MLCTAVGGNGLLGVFFFLVMRQPRRSTLFPYTTLFRSLLKSMTNLLVPPSRASRTFCLSSWRRSEEHTSELQSRLHLVCRLLLEKKKKASTLDQQVLLHLTETAAAANPQRQVVCVRPSR